MTVKERIEKGLEAREAAERRAKELARLAREARSCKNCRHYVQHYRVFDDKGKRWLEAIYSGHCIEPRVKLRNPDNTCEHFERDEQREVHEVGWGMRI